ncbi:hypothetical protein TNCV_434271 [Trichonephila clavipes]|nr:hypothetical protein TNCV_434271 [Trichonephila clavipes]
MTPFELLFGTKIKSCQDIEIVQLHSDEITAQLQEQRDAVRQDAKKQIYKVQMRIAARTISGTDKLISERVNGKFAQFCVMVKNRTEVVVWVSRAPHPQACQYGSAWKRELYQRFGVGPLAASDERHREHFGMETLSGLPRNEFRLLQSLDPMMIKSPVNFASEEAKPLIEFLKRTLNLTMNADAKEGATRYGTTINAVFSRFLG